MAAGMLPGMPQFDVVRAALNAEDHFEASACRGAKCIHSQKIAQAQQWEVKEQMRIDTAN